MVKLINIKVYRTGVVVKSHTNDSIVLSNSSLSVFLSNLGPGYSKVG